MTCATVSALLTALTLAATAPATAAPPPAPSARVAAESDATGAVLEPSGRRRQPLPTVSAPLLGFLVGGAVGGAALFSSTALAVNAMVLSVGTGAGSPKPPPLMNALMMAGFYGAPLCILAAGAVAVAAVGAALWWGESGWLSIALGTGALLVAGALAVPVAVSASMMLAMTVVAPTANWSGALGPAGTLTLMTAAVGASIAVVSAAGGAALGAVTATAAGAGAFVQHSFE
jgi:hypothetical protein